MRPQSGHRAVFYENINVNLLQGTMIARRHDFLRRTSAMLALLLLAVELGGCAQVGDSFASAAFVDPARYDLYDCKQLEGERKTLATRSAELQGLIAKAHTGV